jgi:hypothetical protein
VKFVSSSRIKYTDYWEEVPVVYIHVNFHFIRTKDYGLNFGALDGNCPNCPNNAQWSGDAVANYLVNEMNQRLSAMQDQILRRNLNAYDPITEGYIVPPVPFLDSDGNAVPNLIDSKIRFILYDSASLGSVHYWYLDEYKFHSNGALSSLIPCQDGQLPIPSNTFKTEYSVYGTKVLDFFFMDEYYPIESYVNSDNKTVNCRAIRGVSKGDYNCIYNMWYYWQASGGNLDAINEQVGNLLHEFGHSLGLPHPFESKQCCDILEGPYVNFSAPNVFLKNYDISNNIMGYNSMSNFFTSCQLDILHHNARKVQYSALLEDDFQNYCLKNNGIDEITNHQLWKEDRQIINDIVIRSGASLEITGDICIGFAKRVNIHVERGAVLHIHDDEGIPTLKSLCDPLFKDGGRDDFHWGGIRVAGNSNRTHPDHYLDPLNSDGQDPGRVIIQGANIEDARHAISDDWILEYNPQNWGAYVFCEAVNFRRCHRVAAFMRYRRPHKSKFINCNITGYSVGQVQRKGMGISNWDCRGIEIIGCDIDNIENYGLFTLNGDFKVKNNNRFRNFPAHAIYAGRSEPRIGADVKLEIGSEIGLPNKFINNILDIKIDNYNERGSDHTIIKNNFEYLIQDKFGNVGVEITNSLIQNEANTYDKKYVGASMISNRDNVAPTRKNTFINNFYGIQYIGANNGSEFKCNDFYGYLWGVRVLAGSSIRFNQGSQASSNANRWYRTRSDGSRLDIQIPLDSDISSSQSSSSGFFRYYVKSDIPLNNEYRPRCNLADPCIHPLPIPHYITDNAQHNEDCSLNAFDTEIGDLLSIHTLRLLMDSIALQDSALQFNAEYQDYSVRKFAEIGDTALILMDQELYFILDSLLAIQSEPEYHWYRYGLKLDLEDYTGAEAIVQQNVITFPDEINLDIAYVQTVNLQWQQDDTFRPDSLTTLILEDIAHKQSIGGGYARSLLTWWYDYFWQPFVPEHPDTIAAFAGKVQDLNTPQQVHSQLNAASYVLYPNPGTGNYTLSVEGSMAENLSITVINPADAKVVYQSQQNTSASGSIHLDLQHLPIGMYILAIQSDTHTKPEILKFVKL